MTIKYKLKKALTFIVYHIIHSKSNKKKANLSEMQKHLLGLFKKMIHEPYSQLYYHFKTHDYYEIHDVKNKKYFRLRIYMNEATLEYISLNELEFFHTYAVYQRNVYSRMIQSFNYEIQKRCEKLNSEIEKKMVNYSEKEYIDYKDNWNHDMQLSFNKNFIKK